MKRMPECGGPSHVMLSQFPRNRYWEMCARSPVEIAHIFAMHYLAKVKKH